MHLVKREGSPSRMTGLEVSANDHPGDTGKGICDVNDGYFERYCSSLIGKRESLTWAPFEGFWIFTQGVS